MNKYLETSSQGIASHNCKDDNSDPCKSALNKLEFLKNKYITNPKSSRDVRHTKFDKRIYPNQTKRTTGRINGNKHVTNRDVTNKYLYLYGVKAKRKRKNRQSELNHREDHSKTHLYGNRVTKRSKLRISTLSFVKAVFLTVILRQVICNDVNVTWGMQSNLVVFGETAELTCNITDYVNQCTQFYRQWYGGQKHSLLCRSGTCREPEKYFEVRETNCSFTLKIYNFSESDINCEYSCYYGKIYQRQMLKLDDQHFAYVPKEHDIVFRNKTISSLTDSSHQIEIAIEVSKVYPDPVCNITFEDQTISRYVSVMKKDSGIFYNVVFNITYSPPKCYGHLKMQCEVGNTIFIPYAENVTVCIDEDHQTSDNTQTRELIVAVILVLLLPVVVTCVGLFLRRNCRSTGKREDIELVTPLDDKIMETVHKTRLERGNTYISKTLKEPAVNAGPFRKNLHN